MNAYHGIRVLDNPDMVYWHNFYCPDKQSRIDKVRLMLGHLREGRDWFFAESGLIAIDVFFADPKEAMMFKLRIDW